MEKTVTRAEMEKYVTKMLESQLRQVVEEYVEKNELRLKEISIIERVVRVEEELKAMREVFETRFEAMDKRFEALQRELAARFEAVDKRFEEMDKRFSVVQWMIGILVGIPALAMTVIQVVKVL
jgi:septin family protein